MPMRPMMRLRAVQTFSAMAERKGYHHGNLRQALVDAALKLVVEKGPLGFTVAEAARAAGVSPAAPYRHFKGQAEILEEAARQGYLIFADYLKTAFNDGKPDALRAFEATGRSYLKFAQDYPGYYIAMFESGLSLAGNAELNDAASTAMQVLNDAAFELSLHLPPERRPPPTMISHHIWAMSHGVVELFARGSPGNRAPFSAEELLETGTGIYLRGLGLIPEDT